MSLDSTHLNARTLRMILLRNLAVDAPSYAIAQGMFAQAHLEAALIQQVCSFQSEDFHCEHATVYLAQAMAILRYLRSDVAGHAKSADALCMVEKMFDCLERADALFTTGMMVSPNGIRANYLLNTVKVLKSVLQSDRTLCFDNRTIDCRPETVREPIGELQWQSGILRRDLPEDRPYQLMENIFELLFVSHDDSIALQAYRATIYFCSAVAWWDFFPVRTVGGAKRTLRLLKAAADIAGSMDRNNICIYSFTRTYGEMMPAREFIRHMEKSVKMVEAQCGSDLYTRDDREIIEPGDPDRFSLLMTLNF